MPRGGWGTLCSSGAGLTPDSPKEKPSLCTSHTFSVSYQASSAAICSSVLACGTEGHGVVVVTCPPSRPLPTSLVMEAAGLPGHRDTYRAATVTLRKPQALPACPLPPGTPAGSGLQRPPGPLPQLQADTKPQGSTSTFIMATLGMPGGAELPNHSPESGHSFQPRAGTQGHWACCGDMGHAAGTWDRDTL